MLRVDRLISRGGMVIANAPDYRSARAAYEAIAPSYDAFTAHHDFELWLGNLLPELERHGLSGNRLLDVACGTGNSFLLMRERGWEVVGCDVSPAMLARAKAKTNGKGKRATLKVADMRELPVFGQFNLAWALTDSLNYLLTITELRAALTGMRRNLAPDGLVMFDLNTLLTYRTDFAETEVVERDGRRMIWRGLAADNTPPGCVCEARFETVTEGEALNTHYHRQRHFAAVDVRASLGAAGLECLDVFGHGEDAVLQQPLDELRHRKAVYIARARPGAPA